MTAPSAASSAPPGRLLIVGTGLIGTSLGLAAGRAGWSVHLHDTDPARVALAASLGAGEGCADEGCGGFRLAVVCVPPAAVGTTCVALLRSEIAATVTHVAGVQTQPQAEVEASGAPLGRFLGSHPLAGRETSGPAGADADLFADRPWAVCPTPATEESATAEVRALVESVGAVAVELDAQTHDRLVAQVSHVPQLVASALAAAMDADGGAAALASNGFRDTTRVADSPPGLWGEVVSANREGVAAALDRVLAPLHRLRELLAVEADDADLTAEVHRLVTAGHAGRALLPGKHGRPARMWASVSVAIPDEAGALARLLADIAHAAVNVEDLRLEHAPGRPRGLAELAVAPADRDGLLAALAAQGWTAVAGPEAPL